MKFSSMSRDEVYSFARSHLEPAAYGELLESITAAIYQAVIRDGDCVVDCGANIGRHTIGMGRLVGEIGRVHSFEVSPVVLPWLKERIAAAGIAGRVTLHEAALTRKSGTIVFHFTEGGGYGMSGLQPRELSAELSKTVRYVPTTVRATTLDSEIVVASAIRFIKLDLEGGEFDALVGGKNILAGHRPVVVFENGLSDSAKQYDYTIGDFFEFFSSINYRVYDVFGYPFEPNDWNRGKVPWQFIALPYEVPLGPELKGVIARELVKAGF